MQGPVVRYLTLSAHHLYPGNTLINRAIYVYANLARASYLMKMILRNFQMMAVFLFVVFDQGMAQLGLASFLERP